MADQSAFHRVIDAAASTQATEIFARIFDGTALQSFIVSYNSMLLAVATGLATWGLLSAVVSTAAQGQVLGNRSGAWVPVRFVLAAGLLFPTVDGYSGAQYLVRKVATWGSAAADLGWHTAVGAVARDGLPLVRTEARPPYELAGGLYSIHLCGQIESTNRGIEREAPRLTFEIREDGNGGVVAAYWLGSFAIKPCGSVAVTGAPGATGDVAKIQAAHVAGLKVISDNMRAAALETVKYAYPGELPWKTKTPPDLNKYIEPAIASYISLVNAAANNNNATAPTATANEATEIEGEGWTGAGAALVRLARVNDGRFAATRYDASISPPAWTLPGASKFLVETTAGPILSSAATLWETAMFRTPGGASGYARGGPSRDVVPPAPKKEEEKGLFASLLEGPAVKAVGYAKDMLKQMFTVRLQNVLRERANATTNPLTASVSLGNELIDIGVGAYFTAAGLAAMAGILQGSGVAAAVIMAGLITPAANALIVAGVVLAYVIPMAAFVYFTTGVISWIAMVVEGVAAAPLWVIRHMTLEGEDLRGGATQGYLLLLNILLTPPLLVFGLLASWTVYTIGYELFERLFWPANMAAALNTETGIILGIATVCLYVALLAIAAVTAFGWLGELPNRVLTWVNGQAQAAINHVEAGNRVYAVVSGGSNAATGAAAGGISGATNRAARPDRNGGGGKPRPSADTPAAGRATTAAMRSGGAAQVAGMADGGSTGGNWTQQTGGAAGLAGADLDAAQTAYGRWSESNPDAAAKHGFSGYVGYVQQQQAKG